MPALPALLLLFVIAPALLGYRANVYASPAKRVWYYRHFLIIKDWPPLRHAMLAFALFTALLYTTGALKMLGIPLAPMLGWTLISLTWLSAMAYLYCYFEISSLRSRLPWKTLGALLAITVATLSKILSDQVIADLTRLPPRELLGAQLLLGVCMTVLLWCVAVAIAQGCFAFVSLGLMLRAMIRDYVSLRKKQKYDVLPDLAAVAATYLSALISLNAVADLSGKGTYERPAREAIAFAAFNLPASYCGLADDSGALIAPLQGDTSAVAIPDETLGYRFEPVECPPLKKTHAQINALLGPQTEIQN